ncbi:MAG: amidohydrolase family protein [Candidatus Omnitrophica bacterium]|nr:amidohydrolase family protein [Candidatus Omnitrophota bacterium]
MANRKIINVHGHLHGQCNLSSLVIEWEKEGVIKFCVLALGRQWQSEGYWGNKQVLKAMKEFPEMIAGLGHIELGGPFSDQPEKVERLKEQGFSGLKFISPESPYNDERYFPFYEKAEKLGLPILFHVGIVAVHPEDRIYGVNSDFMRPYLLDRVARCFPNLKIILGHPGEPHIQEGLTLISTYSNIYLCPCGGGASNFHLSKLKQALYAFPGAEWTNPEENFGKRYLNKFVFGTDNPPVLVWYRQSVKLLDFFGADEKIRELFFWKNAANIFSWSR